MNPTTPNYSNAPVGSSQRTNDLINASKTLLNSAPNIPVTTTLSAPSIANNQSVNIPTLNTPNTTQNLGLLNNSVFSKVTSDANVTPPPATTSSTKDLLTEAMKQYTTGISTQASDISKINSDAQLLDKKKAATELANSITQYDKEYRDQVQQLKQNFQGTTGGLQSELNALQDRYQNTRANMALSYSVANNDYQGAQEIANQKIQSLKDTNAAYLETYKLQADAIRNNLSDTESKQLDSQLRTKEANDRALTEAYTTAITEGYKNGLPAAAFNAIDVAAKKPGATAASIFGALSNYGISKSGLKYQELPDGRAVMLDSQGNIVKEVSKAPQTKEEKQALIDSAESLKAIPALTDKINAINGLIDSGNYKSIVGTTAFGRSPSILALSTDSFTGKAQEALGTIKQLISRETLDNLINLKKAGGTLGALSDQERIMLQNAATKIGSWEVLDSKGNPTGRYNVSEAFFKKELETIKNLTQRAINNARGVSKDNPLGLDIAGSPGSSDSLGLGI